MIIHDIFAVFCSILQYFLFLIQEGVPVFDFIGTFNLDMFGIVWRCLGTEHD